MMSQKKILTCQEKLTLVSHTLLQSPPSLQQVSSVIRIMQESASPAARTCAEHAKDCL